MTEIPFAALKAASTKWYLWPLLPIVALLSLPFLALAVSFHIIVHIILGIFLALRSAVWRVEEWDELARVRERVADFFRMRWATVTAWAHSRWLLVREWAAVRWRHWVKWLVAGPFVFGIGLPLRLLHGGISRSGSLIESATDKIIASFRSHVGGPLNRWAERGSEQ